MSTTSQTIAEARAAGLHVMCVFNCGGDTRTTWDPADPVQVAQARERFEAVIKGGYMAYTGETSGDRQQLRKFSPAATEIVLVPQYSGG